MIKWWHGIARLPAVAVAFWLGAWWWPEYEHWLMLAATDAAAGLIIYPVFACWRRRR